MLFIGQCLRAYRSYARSGLLRSSIAPMMLCFLFCVGTAGQENSLHASLGDHVDARILFVGNSLTYTNNLPELVRNTAAQKGIILEVEMIAYPNYAIEDHWDEGKVQTLIKTGKYHFVIIQQGPSSQADGRKMLIEYGRKYRELCGNNAIKLCFFMVWPSLDHYRTFEGVIDNYREAAEVNEAILLPVGEVWKAYLEDSGDLDLYGPDGFHPSLKGSKMAAEVIVDRLFAN